MWKKYLTNILTMILLSKYGKNNVKTNKELFPTGLIGYYCHYFDYAACGQLIC